MPAVYPCVTGGALRLSLCYASEPKTPYLDVRYMSIDQLRQIRAGRGFDEAKDVLMYFAACVRHLFHLRVAKKPDPTKSAADWGAFLELLHQDRYEGGMPEDAAGANALTNERSAAFFDLCEKYNIFLMC